ncbi:MAG: hypothetical protein MJ166_03785 [Clostridia bacterium]|nr:hypothetical protein [Clostridia bacterium]
MNWVCEICSTTNDNSNSVCFVCGSANTRPKPALDKPKVSEISTVGKGKTKKKTEIVAPKITITKTVAKGSDDTKSVAKKVEGTKTTTKKSSGDTKKEAGYILDRVLSVYKGITIVCAIAGAIVLVLLVASILVLDDVLDFEKTLEIVLLRCIGGFENSNNNLSMLFGDTIDIIQANASLISERFEAGGIRFLEAFQLVIIVAKEKMDDCYIYHLSPILDRVSKHIVDFFTLIKR